MTEAMVWAPVGSGTLIRSALLSHLSSFLNELFKNTKIPNVNTVAKSAMAKAISGHSTPKSAMAMAIWPYRCRRRSTGRVHGTDLVLEVCWTKQRAREATVTIDRCTQSTKKKASMLGAKTIKEDVSWKNRGTRVNSITTMLAAAGRYASSELSKPSPESISCTRMTRDDCV